jgi:hypothetical protein
LEYVREAPNKGSLMTMEEAERILDRSVNQLISKDWRTRIFEFRTHARGGCRGGVSPVA